MLVDTPPVLPVADTLTIGRLAAGAVLVVEAGGTSGAAARRAKDALTRNQTRLLGVVLNRFNSKAAAGVYGGAGEREYVDDSQTLVTPRENGSGRGRTRVTDEARQSNGSGRPPATIVLATHARPAFLADCVASIAAAMSDRDELIVMECCNDEAGDLLAHLRYASCGTCQSRTRPRPSSSTGAFVLARGELILITDDDCRVAPEWVDTMTRPFHNPAVGVAFGPVVGLSAAPGTSPAVIPPGPGPTELWFYTHGASMAVRRTAVEAIGGFDERLGPGAPVHGEEADLVLRMLAGGWTCEVADAPHVEHLEWRDNDENLANLRVYQRGLGAYIGLALRRDTPRGLKLLLLRMHHERVWWEEPRLRGWRFGPMMTVTFARGVLAGVRLPPRRFLPQPQVPERVGAGKAKLLWVTDEPPDRNLGGGNIRQARLLERLSDRLDVTLLLVGRLRDEAVHRDLVECFEVAEPRPERRPRNLIERRVRDVWQALARRLPSEVVVTSRVRRVMKPVLDRLADEFDVVVVQHLAMARVLPAHRKSQWILSVNDVPSGRARQERAGAGRRQRWLLSRDAVKASRYEHHVVSTYDGVIVVSDEDATALAGPGRERARGPVIVIPNGVDTDVLTPTPLPAAPNVLLPASLNYRPNILGAIWFCDEVLPRVQAKVPDVRFALAGRQPVSQILALAGRSGVEVHADVPRMAPWLEWARVVVVPLHVGTGTRLKALEAMSAGRPVAGTRIGLEGLGIVDGIHARVVDEAETMADAIVELLTSDATANALAAAGRQHVEDHFRWQALGEHAAAALEAAAGARRSAR